MIIYICFGVFFNIVKATIPSTKTDIISNMGSLSCVGENLYICFESSPGENFASVFVGRFELKIILVSKVSKMRLDNSMVVVAFNISPD